MGILQTCKTSFSASLFERNMRSVSGTRRIAELLRHFLRARLLSSSAKLIPAFIAAPAGRPWTKSVPKHTFHFDRSNVLVSNPLESVPTVQSESWIFGSFYGYDVRISRSPLLFDLAQTQVFVTAGVSSPQRLPAGHDHWTLRAERFLYRCSN